VRAFGRLSPYFYWHQSWLQPVDAGLQDRLAATGTRSAHPVGIVQRFDVIVSYDPTVAAAAWELLEPHATAFQTRAWLLPLYRIVAPALHMTPLFVTVSDRSSSRPMMILPLCIGRKWGLTVIEFADFGVTDYNAPPLSPTLTLTVAEARDLWDDICHALPPADIVLFDKVPETVSGQPVPLAQLGWMRRMAMRAWTVRLPETRAEYDRTILKAKDRKEHRRKRRALTEWLGDLTLVHAATAGERQEIFEALKCQREARCKEAGYRDLLVDPTFERFYQSVAYGEFGDVAMLSALKAQDRIVATLFALSHNSDYLLVAHCFEPCAEGLSPGIVAIDEMITHQIGLGARNFDLTIGNEGYKRQFGVTPSVLWEGMYPLSAKGWLFAQAEETRRHVKSTLAPQLAVYRRLVRERWERIAGKDWTLARVNRRSGRDARQAAATEPQKPLPVPPAVEPAHNPG
jgi:CelD/BcsL family acetyltransferase involved in cellulose biosynthesis